MLTSADMSAYATAALHPDARWVNAAARAGYDGKNPATKSRTAAASAAGSPPGWGRGVPGPQPRIKPVCA